MDTVLIHGYEFIKKDLKGAVALFSTAKNNLDFNKATDYGRTNLHNLKQWFDLKDVGYLNQVHGDKMIFYKNKVEDGDGIYTTEPNRAVGVFNADCVPILIYDKKNSVIAAVHSGWRGTLNLILMKSIEKLKKEYKSSAEDIIICVGPHIHECCYEVGKELIDEFCASDFYRNKDIFNNNNLNLKKCLIYQMEQEGIKKENITYLDLCTHCSKDYKLHSYRKNKKCGRMFSFIYMY